MTTLHVHHLRDTWQAVSVLHQEGKLVTYRALAKALRCSASGQVFGWVQELARAGYLKVTTWEHPDERRTPHGSIVPIVPLLPASAVTIRPGRPGG